MENVDSTTVSPNKHGDKREREEDDQQSTNKVQAVEPSAELAEKDGSGLEYTSAAATGAPGSQKYSTFKPPNSTPLEFKKTFFVEINNSDFIQRTADHTGGGSVHQLVAPYFQFPWQYLFWYLDHGEACYINRANHAKVRNAEFQINVIGHRLPFTTNDESSSVANSMTDQTLDVFRSLEKTYPFATFYIPSETDASAGKHLNDIQDLRNYMENNFVLYGWPAQNATDSNKLGANQRYREWQLRPVFSKENVASSKGFDNALYSGFPPFAHLKESTYDLKTFRGPLCRIGYKPTNGVLNMTSSVISNALYESDYQDYIMTTKKQIFAHSTNTATTIDFGRRTQINRDFKPMRNLYRNQQPKGIYTGNLDSADYFHPQLLTLEGPFTNTRNEFAANSFQSLILGVRPQYNGSVHQRGVLQLEIETRIVIDVQWYWPNHISLLNSDTWGNLNNTNDLDVLLNTGAYGLPSYGIGSKQTFQVRLGDRPLKVVDDDGDADDNAREAEFEKLTRQATRQTKVIKESLKQLFGTSKKPI